MSFTAAVIDRPNPTQHDHVDDEDGAHPGHRRQEVMPTVLVLNAGARLNMGPIDKLTFDEFSTNWNTDVKPIFNTFC
jgi:hypothetical protein